MDREKVIKGLEECTGNGKCTKCQYGKEKQTLSCKKLLADALELLKEQEAVEPIITPWAEDDDGNIVLAKKECGRCGCQFFTERPNFCENCGTPILWERR